MDLNKGWWNEDFILQTNCIYVWPFKFCIFFVQDVHRSSEALWGFEDACHKLSDIGKFH